MEVTFKVPRYQREESDPPRIDSFVIENGKVWVLYNGKFVFKVEMIPSQKNAIGIWTRSDTTFRRINVRK